VLVTRRARVGDAERLVEMMVLGALIPGKEDAHDIEPYRAALAEIENTPFNEMLVAEQDGVVVGMCQLFAVRHFSGRGGLCAEVEAMHVHPDFRGKGVGSRLLGEAVQHARDWGCYRVQLTSHKARKEAHRFYERAGFVATHEGFKLPIS
jgi:GNAT superfamily N-acetyltransferase